MADEDAEPEVGVETFGVLRLPLAARTASGYVGVRHVPKSKIRPWQAWVHIKGERRRCLGSFRKPQEAAVARAKALACGPETLPSPRKQAARDSGAALLPRAVSVMLSIISSSLLRVSLYVLCCVQSNDWQAMRPRPTRFPTSTARIYLASMWWIVVVEACSRLVPRMHSLLRHTLHHTRAVFRPPGGCCPAILCPRAWQPLAWP